MLLQSKNGKNNVRNEGDGVQREEAVGGLDPSKSRYAWPLAAGRRSSEAQ